MQVAGRWQVHMDRYQQLKSIGAISEVLSTPTYREKRPKSVSYI